MASVQSDEKINKKCYMTDRYYLFRRGLMVIAFDKEFQGRDFKSDDV